MRAAPSHPRLAPCELDGQRHESGRPGLPCARQLSQDIEGAISGATISCECTGSPGGEHVCLPPRWSDRRSMVGIGSAIGRLLSTLAFGGGIAAIMVGLGTRDLESYEHAFFSLNRGTALQTLEVLGHPVYTLGIGLGTRLPLSGSLGASPIAAVAPYMPSPLTYWALMAFSIGAAVMIARHALEPMCGRVASWFAMVLLFCSLPMVNYAVTDDWPEGVVNYCVFVGCVFAPHALLALRHAQVSSNVRRLVGLSLVGAAWGLIGLSHPGLWPLLAAALVLTATLALCRSDHPLRARLTIVAALAVASFVAVALQLPDFVRELDIARESGAIGRAVLGPSGRLISANGFPFGSVDPRMPFTFLVMALLSLSIGLTLGDPYSRRLTVVSALMSIVLAIAAASVTPGSAVYAPSTTWMLRDPAMAFAILSAACAAGALRRSRELRSVVGVGPVVAVLAIAGLQGPSLAASLILTDIPTGASWNQDMTTRQARVSVRGLDRDRVPPGERLALWPGVRRSMRQENMASTDFADAGYLLSTAWTKQRTMAGLVSPNTVLFDQATDLSPQILCNPNAVGFLQLRYLVMPPDADCEPWARLSAVQVDNRFDLAVATAWDDMVRAFSLADVSERVARAPALSAGSILLPALVPLSGTSLTIGASSVAIRLAHPSLAEGHALVLPVAYDSAWHTSSGQVRNAGGLVALVGVDNRQVHVDYVPDSVAVLRAASMTLAQVLAVVGFLGLACVRPARPTPGD